ncbi:MAG: GntR family transcriptional regulator [Candidatus Dormiibacterota bacterium]
MASSTSNRLARAATRQRGGARLVRSAAAAPYGRVGSIPKGTLGESAFEVLRDAILTGRLFSGQRLVETKLASELGISRGPLREALALLQKDGLIEVVPRRGRFVLAFTEPAVEEFYRLRLVLETYAVGLVIASLDEEKLRTLERAAQRLERAEEVGVAAKVIAADLEFHESLYDLSGHQLLRAIWKDTMASKLRLLIYLTVRDKYDPPPKASHGALVAAIRRRDIKAAEEFVADHIDDSLRRALAAIGTDDAETESASEAALA